MVLVFIVYIIRVEAVSSVPGQWCLVRHNENFKYCWRAAAAAALLLSV